MHFRGFTLIELLVVVAILGALAAIVVVPLTGKTFEARHASLLADINTAQKIIVAMEATDSIYWRSCSENTPEGRALRKIIAKYKKPQYAIVETYTYDYDPRRTYTEGKTPYTFFGIAHESIGYTSFSRNAASERTERLLNNAIPFSAAPSGCLAAIGDETRWIDGKKHGIIIWLQDVDSDGNIITVCADIYGNRESIRGGIINWNFPVWNSASSFGNGERSSFHCPCLLRHNC